MADPKKLTIVLDLDETLVHANEKPVAGDHYDFITSEGDYVYKRPHLDFFLQNLAKDFNVGVWSVSGDYYVTEILSLILPTNYPLLFQFTGQNCVNAIPSSDDFFGNGYPVLIKDLRKLLRKYPWISLKRTLAIDDKPSNYRRQYSNVLAIPPFRGEKIEDSALLDAYTYLTTLSSVDNVRPIEKRGWRTHLTKKQP